MSDSQRIDDVLNSIRRLVSEEVAEQAIEATKDTLPPDALILDSEKRVIEPEDPFRSVPPLPAEEADPVEAQIEGAAESPLADDEGLMPRWDIPQDADDAAPAVDVHSDMTIPPAPEPAFTTSAPTDAAPSDTPTDMTAEPDGPSIETMPVYAEEAGDNAEDDLVLDFIESLPDAIEEADAQGDQTDAAINAVLARGDAEGWGRPVATPKLDSAVPSDAASSDMSQSGHLDLPVQEPMLQQEPEPQQEPENIAPFSDPTEEVTLPPRAVEEVASPEVNFTEPAPAATESASPFAFFANTKPLTLEDGDELDALAMDTPPASEMILPEPTEEVDTASAPSIDAAFDVPAADEPVLDEDAPSEDVIDEPADEPQAQPEAQGDIGSQDFVLVDDDTPHARAEEPVEDIVEAAAETIQPEEPLTEPEVLEADEPGPQIAPEHDADEEEEEDILSGGIGPEASAAALDTEALRELVAEVVRQELAGALGERITRNVRKLVRRELKTMFSGDEFD